MSILRVLRHLTLVAILYCHHAFARYNYVLPISDYQRSVLNQAFDDAITIAALATTISQGPTINAQNQRIFAKYFQPQDMNLVMSIINQIVGGNTHTGNTTLSTIAVDVNDNKKSCPPPGDGKFYSMHIDLEGYIAVCPDFWTTSGNLPPTQCSDLSDITSLQMGLYTPGATIFHEFIHYVGVGAINGQNIIDYAFKPPYNSPTGPIAYGPVTPLGLNQLYPSFTTRSASNYEWYALEVYWSFKCNRSFRNPGNAMEAQNGKCYQQECAWDGSG